MSGKKSWIVGSALLLASVAGCAVCGDGHHQAISPEERTGHPYEVSCIAHPSDTGHYIGYEVGGGSARCGEGPSECEGTWGWDYSGLWLPSRVALDWFHGKEQGGYGAYKIDGPRPIEEFDHRND
jgi:hypothetical protein